MRAGTTEPAVGRTRHRASTIMAFGWALVLASLSACSGGTEPTSPIVVRDGKLLGEFEGAREYDVTGVTLRLAVENEVRPEITGLWEMSYTASIGGAEGTFSGVYEDGVLTLHLAAAEGCAGGYTVTGSALDEFGYRWNLSLSASGDCPRYVEAGAISVQKVSDIGDFP